MAGDLRSAVPQLPADWRRRVESVSSAAVADAARGGVCPAFGGWCDRLGWRRGFLRLREMRNSSGNDREEVPEVRLSETELFETYVFLDVG